MKIALVGYGRMGHEIEKIALERGHEISYRITDTSNEKVSDIRDTDVAIEFTQPDAAFTNVSSLIKKNIPVICGTTGWNDNLPQVKKIVSEHNGSFLHSSNFSIGVNIFFEINKKLAFIMNQFEEYNVSVEEIHHVKKLDAPSGTAVTIAEHILQNLTRKKSWKLSEDENQQKEVILVNSIREGDVPGTHSVKYHSEIDDIEIIHKAHNRKGFAKGAVLAAEWIKDKKGFFNMNDFLKL